MKGVIQCIFRRVEWHGAQIIAVDMWASGNMPGVENSFTSFRACVYMEGVGDRYKIMQSPRNQYNNSFWNDLEIRLSNIILVNEWSEESGQLFVRSNIYVSLKKRKASRQADLSEVTPVLRCLCGKLLLLWRRQKGNQDYRIAALAVVLFLCLQWSKYNQDSHDHLFFWVSHNTEAPLPSNEPSPPVSWVTIDLSKIHTLGPKR